MSFACHEFWRRFLGLFQISILHSIGHLLFGVADCDVAVFGAARALIGGGVIYLVLSCRDSGSAQRER